MVSELLGTLQKQRSAVERGGETWESLPAPSSADASSELAGVPFGSAPPAKDWLKKKVEETPEEDLLADAFSEVLAARGVRPSHAPAEDTERLKQLLEQVANLQKELAQERSDVGTARDELARREAAIKAEAEEEERRLRERQQYQQPAWLENLEGTLNVAVVGNSGVGKSLLINRLRRSQPGSPFWAPVGVKETTLKPTMYAFPGKEFVRLWDLPGADTENFPRATYIQNMGLRYFDSILIVTAGRFTTMETEIRAELQAHRVPHFLVRSKADIDVWNNQLDNKMDEEATIRQIRDDMLEVHGAEHLYIVSSRDPEKYDMQSLLWDAFPGLRRQLNSNAPIFTPGQDSPAWGDAWALPEAHSPVLSAIQGHWQDMKADLMYIVEGDEVHITDNKHQSAVVPLVEDGRLVWFCDKWYIDMTAVVKARQTAELRWAPSDLKNKPRVWCWKG
mmetsp:Transcript_99990/g.173489  ORF Transcript_99990/g.173489 Transcript_99990/m.173489 type:complete len:450 (+) Transcript_99990:49-1398(+)